MTRIFVSLGETPDLRFATTLLFCQGLCCQGSPLVKVSAERIEAVDLEKKSMTYSIIGGEMLEYYKTFKGTITVTPKDGGSILKWFGEFEKTAHEIDDPHVIKDFAVKNFKEIDEYLLKQSSV